jgi:VWFA-related protein
MYREFVVGARRRFAPSTSLLSSSFLLVSSLLVVAFLSELAVVAQQPTISVKTSAVSVPATVRDKHGKIVSDLTKESFQLDEDGKTQTIDYFSREGNLPLRISLLVDTSLSQRRVLGQERDASYTFLDKLLRPEKDVASVINFDREVTLLQDFTAAKPKLQAALQQLETPSMSRSSGGGSGGGNGSGGGDDPNGGYGGRGGSGGGGGRSGHRGGAGTLLYDAVFLASDELMSKQQGRKALIVLSDGVDHGSKETLAEAVAAAQKSDTVVYSILFADDEAYGHGGGFGMGGPYGGHGGYGGGRGGGRPQQQEVDGKKILEEISTRTGGRMFKVSKKDTVDKIYAEIDEELRNQYVLGYTPAKDTSPGYHRIHLSTFNKDLKVQTRDGWYSAEASAGTDGPAENAKR